MAKKKKKVLPPRPDRTLLVTGVLLFLVTFFFYWPSLSSGFVYDADAQIGGDDYIHTTSHLWDVVTLRVLSQDVLDGTRPIHLLSLMLDALVWERDPFGYHLTNNILHAGLVVLVFLLLVEWTKSDRPKPVIPALGALLFALHPVNVEVVAEVSYREDLLATGFIVLGLWLASRFRTRGRDLAWGAGVVLAFFLAAGAKETGYVAPVLLVLYWWIYRRDEARRPWVILLLVVSVVVFSFGAARFALQPKDSAIFIFQPEYIGGSFGEVFRLQPRIWVFLLNNILWPVGLAADYVPQNIAWITLPWAIAVLVVLLLIQGFLSWRSRVALLGTAIFWLGLAPVSNFIPIFRPVADRFLYLPMVGLACLLCAVLILLPPRALKVALIFVAAGLMSCAMLSWQRQPVFANARNLWKDTAAKSPYSSTAQNNLAHTYQEEKNDDMALLLYGRSLRINNKDSTAWAGAALSLERLGRSSEAERAMAKAMEYNPAYGDTERIRRAMLEDEAGILVLEQIRRRMQGNP